MIGLRTLVGRSSGPSSGAPCKIISVLSHIAVPGCKKFIGYVDQFNFNSKVVKVDDELGLVFGYAMICAENGKPYYDLQGDNIP